MGQRDDIWNRIIRHKREYEPDITMPSSFLPRGSANGINWIRGNTPLKKYTTLVDRILKNHDLAYLYALDMELNDVISHMANYGFDEDSSVTEKGLKRVLASMAKKYLEIKTIIKPKTLLPELADTRENHATGKLNHFEAPPQMQALAALQEHTQNRIELGAWDGLEKATAMFEGQLIAFPERFNEEALTYLLANSNRNHADAIASAMARWEQQLNYKHLSVGNRITDRPLHFGRHLRLAHWADAGEHFDQWKTIAGHIRLLSPEDILTKYAFRYERCFWEQFMILRSDHAVDLLDRQLDVLLFQWQEWLKNTLVYKKSPHYKLDSSEMMRVVFTIASLFVFGCHRKPRNMLDSTIVKVAEDKLLFTEKPSVGVALTAQIIHALYVATPSGAEDYIKDAANCFCREQTPYGQWYELTTASPVEISVLALDAIHLAWGEGNCTIRRLEKHSSPVSSGGNLPASLPKLATAKELANHYGLSERNVRSTLTKKCGKMTDRQLSCFRVEIPESDGPYPKYMYHTQTVIPILDEMKKRADQKRNTK